MSFHELLELAMPGDYELVNDLIEGFEREPPAVTSATLFVSV